MDGATLTAILFSSLLLTLFLGVPISFALGGCAVIFTLTLWGAKGLFTIVSQIFHAQLNFSFISVPLFIFMGVGLRSSGMAEILYNTMYQWMGRLRGGLAIGTVAICALFAAMVGTSGPATVTMGLVALPSMLQHRYKKDIAIGCIAGGGALGILIPPSIPMVLLGMSVDLSIGELFMAGVIPGLILTALLILYVVIRCLLDPDAAPPLPPEERVGWHEKLAMGKTVVLPIIVVVIVLGSIFAGICTVTESAALGSVGVILSAVLYGKFTKVWLEETLLETFRITGFVMWIVFGAYSFSATYNALGAQQFARELLSMVPGGVWGVIIVTQLSWFFLGMFLDPAGIIMITAPIFFPLIISMGLNPIWFGVVFMVNLEMAYLTPPFGFNLFYLSGVAPKGITFGEIVRSCLPIIFVQMVALVITIAFPVLSLWLPRMMLR